MAASLRAGEQPKLKWLPFSVRVGDNARPPYSCCRFSNQMGTLAKAAGHLPSIGGLLRRVPIQKAYSIERTRELSRKYFSFERFSSPSYFNNDVGEKYDAYAIGISVIYFFVDRAVTRVRIDDAMVEALHLAAILDFHWLAITLHASNIDCLGIFSHNMGTGYRFWIA